MKKKQSEFTFGWQFWLMIVSIIAIVSFIFVIINASLIKYLYNPITPLDPLEGYTEECDDWEYKITTTTHKIIDSYSVSGKTAYKLENSPGYLYGDYHTPEVFVKYIYEGIDYDIYEETFIIYYNETRCTHHILGKVIE